MADSSWHAQKWRGFAAEGVRFTDEASLSTALTFWSFRMKDVVTALEQHGWYVEDFAQPQRG